MGEFESQRHPILFRKPSCRCRELLTSLACSPRQLPSVPLVSLRFWLSLPLLGMPFVPRYFLSLLLRYTYQPLLCRLQRLSYSQQIARYRFVVFRGHLRLRLRWFRRRYHRRLLFRFSSCRLISHFPSYLRCSSCSSCLSRQNCSSCSHFPRSPNFLHCQSFQNFRSYLHCLSSPSSPSSPNRPNRPNYLSCSSCSNFPNCSSYSNSPNHPSSPNFPNSLSPQQLSSYC